MSCADWGGRVRGRIHAEEVRHLYPSTILLEPRSAGRLTKRRGAANGPGMRRPGAGGGPARKRRSSIMFGPIRGHH
jgi:hypothetical protein